MNLISKEEFAEIAPQEPPVDKAQKVPPPPPLPKKGMLTNRVGFFKLGAAWSGWQSSNRQFHR